MAETCEYDRFGYPSKKTDSLGQTEEMRYNLMGLLRYAVDKEGREQYYDYTAYGSLAQRGDDDGLYAYRHSRNNLLKKAFHYGHDEEIDYTYDELGYLQSEEDATYRREYTNDVNGNRKSMILKKKQGNAWTQLQRIDYIYDKLDRLWRVNVNNHETDQWYNYDANNRVTREGYFQSRSLVGTLDYTYNHAGWITGISETDGTPYTQSYDYRLDGNMIRKTDSRNGSETQYRYDAMGQLLAEELRVNGATTETGYAYDARGNRISKNENGVISHYTYDTNNRLVSESRETDGITTVQNYSYDKVGNLLQRATGTFSAPGGAAELQLSAVSEGMADDLSGAEVVNYTYHANNLLTGIATDQGQVTSYAYDVHGRRISKTVNGSTTHQIWDGQNIVREETAAGAEHDYYYSRRLFAKKTGDEILRYLYDGHGSVIGLDNVDDYDYDEDGNVIDHNNGDRYDYDAFGNLRSVTGESHNPFRYCGEYLDAESGLIYLRNRYYDPHTGRFITEDPAKDGTNWYVYCGNNPVNYIDPLGLDAIIITNSNSVGIEGVVTAGHTSALYQDITGSWYYTYWGNKATAVIYIPNEYMDSLGHFNEGLNSILNHYGYKDITSDYNHATYIVGDFTASLQAAYDDVDSAYPNPFSKGTHCFDETNGNFVYQGQNSPYNVLYNNCFDRTYASLRKGTLENGNNVGDYMKDLGFKGGMIPNNAISKFGEVFMNSSFDYWDAYRSLLNYADLYAQNSPWAQKWEKANYANSVIGW